ncbi:unnamed protein product [Caenorhabditis sp. 36 PRJEB53466]|nr:unnamed protein product [Caenorhabditis sp. 36 PRJEB53466]
MYDTLVLYLAVFPENEIVRKDPNADPRWESWPVLPPNSILSQWAISNVKKMLDLITKADVKSSVDLSAVWNKLMAMASSFGRMGIDFRPLIAGKLTTLVEQRFRQNVHDATNRLTGSSRDIVMIGIDPASLPQFESSPDSPPVPVAELSLWDDMTVYANAIVDALNSLRFILTPVILSTVVISLRDSVRSILSWLAISHSNSANFTRAVRIVCTCLAPFFEKCVSFFFPPAVVTRVFGSSITKQQYLSFIELDMQELAASCDGADKIEEIVRPLLQKRTLADINLDTVLKAKFTEKGGTAKFFLEDTPEEAEEIAVEQETKQEAAGKVDGKSVKIEISIQNGSVKPTQKAEVKEKKPSFDKLEQPPLPSIPEHADVIIPGEHRDVLVEESVSIDNVLTEATQEYEYQQEPIENSASAENVQTESTQGDAPAHESASNVNTESTQKEEQNENVEPEEEWGWGEEEGASEEEEVKIPIKKGGKDD